MAALMPERTGDLIPGCNLLCGDLLAQDFKSQVEGTLQAMQADGRDPTLELLQFSTNEGQPIYCVYNSFHQDYQVINPAEFFQKAGDRTDASLSRLVNEIGYIWDRDQNTEEYVPFRADGIIDNEYRHLLNNIYNSYSVAAEVVKRFMVSGNKDRYLESFETMLHVLLDGKNVSLNILTETALLTPRRLDDVFVDLKRVCPDLRVMGSVPPGLLTRMGVSKPFEYKVLRELFNNAFKYGNGQPLELAYAVAHNSSKDAEGLSAQGLSLIVELRDSGIGFDPELLPHVFMHESLGDNSSSEVEGGEWGRQGNSRRGKNIGSIQGSATGIDSLLKEVVHRRRGRISVASRYNIGGDDPSAHIVTAYSGSIKQPHFQIYDPKYKMNPQYSTVSRIEIPFDLSENSTDSVIF